MKAAICHMHNLERADGGQHRGKHPGTAASASLSGCGTGRSVECRLIETYGIIGRSGGMPQTSPAASSPPNGSQVAMPLQP